MNVALLARIPAGTFNDSSLLDTIAHFVLPATGTPLLYIILERLQLFPEMARSSKFFVILALGITSAVLWEIFEFSVDRAFGTDWQLSNTDTMTDLILGLIGTLVGTGIFMKVYRNKNFSS